jgi:ATP-binding cassette, subfamily B, bacterial
VSDPRSTEEGAPKPKKAPFGRLRVLAPFISPYKKVVLGALVSLIAAAGATLAVPLALRRIIDFGFSAQGGGFIDQYFAGLFGVVVILAFATFGRFYLVTWLGERLAADVRMGLFNRVVELSPGFFDTTKTGEITSRLTNDVTMIQSALGSTTSVALRNVLLMIGGTVAMVWTSPLLSGLALVVVPVVIVPIIFLGRKVRKLTRTNQDRIAVMTDYATEILGAVRTVQSFTQEANERTRFGGRVATAFETAVKRIRTRGVLTAIVIMLIFGAVDLVLWVGARQVLGGSMSGGQLAQFVLYAIIAASSTGALTEVYGELQQAAGAAERIAELLQTEPEIRAPANPTPLPEPPLGALAFDRVTFHYPSRPDAPALHEFSIDVKAGETVALVGPSGAGKSTVFALITRFYDPEKGVISVDGIDIRTADPLQVRARLGIVPQDTFVFAATAMENIRYGRPDATDEEVRAAAEAAQADEFLDRLPDGFESYLGERGVRLSGGQRQRIAIARAILRDPAILLLDEATSSLDAESERLVQTALERLMTNRTTLVIAHRLATVLKANRIVVMDQGRVVATGSHEDLMRQGGLYARLAELQFSTPAGTASPDDAEIESIGPSASARSAG